MSDQNLNQIIITNLDKNKNILDSCQRHISSTVKNVPITLITQYTNTQKTLEFNQNLLIIHVIVNINQMEFGLTNFSNKHFPIIYSLLILVILDNILHAVF